MNTHILLQLPTMCKKLGYRLDSVYCGKARKNSKLISIRQCRTSYTTMCPSFMLNTNYFFSLISCTETHGETDTQTRLKNHSYNK